MNLLDEFHQATMDGVRYAASKGIGVVVMEPVRGGALVRRRPGGDSDALYEAGAPGRSAAEWAFRWLLDKPEFMTILSGMSNIEQADDNLRIFDAAEAGCLSDAEKDHAGERAQGLRGAHPRGLHGLPILHALPAGSRDSGDLPAATTRASMFGDFTGPSASGTTPWRRSAAARAWAARPAIAACPQHFATPIPEMLRRIHEENYAK